MFPHKKLDWHTTRLERQVEAQPDDVDLLHELARAHLSSGLYHGGGEAACSQALGLAKRVLAETPGRADALVTAGSALLGMRRVDGARRYLDEARRVEPDRADLYLALGALARSEGDREGSVRALERACRLASDRWEPHLYLGRALAELARARGDRRLTERSQFHLVQALKLEPSPDLTAPLLRDLGSSCLATGRYREAEKFFVRLREHERFATTARFHLGMVAYHLGKYKNAIQHWRQYLKDKPDDARVHARMAMAYLQLGEHGRAKEACERALLAKPGDLQARYTLACTHLEEGSVKDAVRVFKETLADNPGHLPTYVELARLRRNARDHHWLGQALCTEAAHFDRLVPAGGPKSPRQLTRQRVAVLLDELRSLGPSSLAAMIRATRLVQEEGVRFQVWEAACELAEQAMADDVAARLRDPGKHYGSSLGRQAIAGARALPEAVLSGGLRLEEEDLKRAAVDRHGQTSQVETLRGHLATERDAARAYQALVLLAVATRRSRAGRRLLQKWNETADPELAVAAEAGLAMYGDADAVEKLRRRAEARGAGLRVDALLRHVVPAPSHEPPRPVSDHEDVHCASCGRTSDDALHLMVGTESVICDVCIGELGRRRKELVAHDEASCHFCQRNQLEARVYGLHGVQICAVCLKLSLGVLEREEVDRFLAAW